MSQFKTFFLFIFISISLFTGCTNKKHNIEINTKNIDFSKKIANDNFMNQEEESKIFLEKYFYAWSLNEVNYNKIEAMWGLGYKFRDIYLENHKPASNNWFKIQENNANFEEYNTLAKKAITLKNTNVRVLPSNSFMFKEPTLQGEGFPFDYNQNSLIKINTPIIVSHLSKDKAWAYIQTHSFGGWVSIQDIAFVDDQFIKEFKTNNYFVAVKEKFPLYDNYFREYIKISTIFPKKQNKYIIAKKDENQNALISYIEIKSTEVEKFPIKYNTENRIKIAKELLHEPYGWGGFLNNRDCSSFTKDFFAPFGKFLKRNSKGQTSDGKYLEVSNYSNENKKLFIMKHGVPFSTLVYLKGHIMLYVGIKDNEPLMMHNMWSVRLKNDIGLQYRHIVGKTSITTLEPLKESKDFDEKQSLLSKVIGIVVL